jgi:hypothetical protein
MKTILVFIVTLISAYSYSQELNVGGSIGTGPKSLNATILTFGGTAEFRLAGSPVSINTDPNLAFISDKTELTIPVYLKFIIGNKLRFCPTVGGFVRIHGNYGSKNGINIEFKIKKSMLLFVTGDYYTDYYKAEYLDHFGPSTEYTDHSSSFWFALGIKKNILKQKIPATSSSRDFNQ